MKSKKGRICYFTGVGDSHLGDFFLEEQEDKREVSHIYDGAKAGYQRQCMSAVGQPSSLSAFLRYLR